MPGCRETRKPESEEAGKPRKAESEEAGRRHEVRLYDLRDATSLETSCATPSIRTFCFHAARMFRVPFRPYRTFRAILGTQQVAGDGFGLGQRDEVAAGQHIGLHPEALACHPLLEVRREEPVVRPGQHPYGDGRPRAEVAD